MKSKVTTPRGKGKMAPSPIRGNTGRPSTMSMNGKTISSAGGTHSYGNNNNNNSSPKNIKPVLKMKQAKNNIIDHQRLLEDQILEDRRRKEAEKEKEDEDELSFMRAMKGNHYGDDYNNSNDNGFNRSKVDFSINTDRNTNNNNSYDFKKSSPNKYDYTDNNGSYSSRFVPINDSVNSDSPQSRAQTAAAPPKFSSLASEVSTGRERINIFRDKNNFGNLRYLCYLIFTNI